VIFGGPGEVRTPDPLVANQVLSQLSYRPKTQRLGRSFMFIENYASRQVPTRGRNEREFPAFSASAQESEATVISVLKFLLVQTSEYEWLKLKCR
jgi:hypothetical protein